MSVRDPGYDPRPSHPRSGARPAGVSRAARGAPGRRRSEARPTAGIVGGAVAIVALVLVVGIGFGGGVFGAFAPAGSIASSSPGPSTAGAAVEPPAASEAPAGSGEAAEAAPPADEAETVEVASETDVAIVPVANFRSTRTSVDAADVEAIPAGNPGFKSLVVVAADADGILAALGLTREELGKRLVTHPSADELAADLATHPKRLGFLRADDVGPAVRALAWGDRSLFGVDRTRRLANWPLTARLSGPATPTYDPAGAWTLFAGGDILLDRGVKLAIDASRAKADFPFDGGTVKVTGMCRDCSPMGWDLPYTKRTGNAGAVRDLVSGADLAIANFENPAPRNPRWHGSGTVFNADPDLIDGLVDAGLDWVSLANNHIGDAGRTGMLQTMKNLDKRGLAHGGLGRDLQEAHEATLLKAGDVTVGFLGYDMIAPVYHAGDTLAGSAGMTKKALKADIKAARKAGADVVVVFPHWGIEYRATPTDTQRRLGHAAIDAGADLVIGNHPHWAEAMEVYKGKPIWYALGNFVFDQTWSDYTMEGITLELTFRDADLVQIRMRPHLILDRAQPNFLDPAETGGAFVMNQVWDASAGLLPW